MTATRRDFIKKTGKAAAGVYLGTLGFSAKSYARILGANDRVQVGVVGLFRPLPRLAAAFVSEPQQRAELRHYCRV
jgi:hypothetical protein